MKNNLMNGSSLSPVPVSERPIPDMRFSSFDMATVTATDRYWEERQSDDVLSDVRRAIELVQNPPTVATEIAMNKQDYERVLRGADKTYTASFRSMVCHMPVYVIERLDEPEIHYSDGTVKKLSEVFQ